MNHRHPNNPAESADPRLTALSSPQRLEIVGLFTEPDPLSIADMAAKTGRPATSLYHHVHVLEATGILQPAGTRPKGKRFETLYRLSENIVQLEVQPHDQAAVEQACKAIASSLHMAERDFAAAFERDDLELDGPRRNLVSLRMHIRTSPEVLEALNERLRAIDDLLLEHAAAADDPGPDDQFLSLTLTLAPLRGRRVDPTSPTPPATGDLS